MERALASPWSVTTISDPVPARELQVGVWVSLEVRPVPAAIYCKPRTMRETGRVLPERSKHRERAGGLRAGRGGYRDTSQRPQYNFISDPF